MVDRDPLTGVQRRVGGAHDYRWFGASDLLLMARGASVLDLGCNRGMVAHELVRHGATLVHGCDKPGSEADTIDVCRQVFADIRQIESRFEACDLRLGPRSLEVFANVAPIRGQGGYDMVLLFGTYHKIKREMDQPLLDELMRYLATITVGHLVWRGGARPEEHIDEIEQIEAAFGKASDNYMPPAMRRVHWSIMSDMGPAVVWRRG